MHVYSISTLDNHNTLISMSDRTDSGTGTWHGVRINRCRGREREQRAQTFVGTHTLVCKWKPCTFVIQIDFGLLCSLSRLMCVCVFTAALTFCRQICVNLFRFSSIFFPLHFLRSKEKKKNNKIERRIE